jgi:anti-sigma factor RsiW
MNCNDVNRVLSAYMDGELPAETRESVVRHLQDCPRCRLAERELADTALLVRAAPHPAPPDGLACRVREALRSQAAAAGGGSRNAASRLIAPLLSAAAAGLAGVLLGTSLASHGPPDDLAADALAAHVRSLIDAQSARIISSDPHAVRPWFAGRLAFAPPSPNFSAEGYPLIGARLDFVGENLVAALAYRRRQHAITVFVWPRDGAAEAADGWSSRNGFTVVRWRSGDLDYTAVSDLNPQELRHLQTLFQQREAQ